MYSQSFIPLTILFGRLYDKIKLQVLIILHAEFFNLRLSAEDDTFVGRVFFFCSSASAFLFKLVASTFSA